MGRVGARRIALLAVALVAGGGALLAYLTDALDRSELDTVDTRFEIRGTQAPPDDLVVVAIDGTSFSDLDRRWPFPRSLHGRMIETLEAAGTAAVVYDVQFTEPTTRREDNALVSAIASASIPVVLATEDVNRRGKSNVLGGESTLRAVGARAGQSSFKPDPGGVFRTLQFQTGGLESIAVATVEERDGVAVDPRDFPRGGAWIDYGGPPGTIPTYSFSKVLDGEVDRSAFEGKTVVVGATSPTLQDVHPVPTSSNQLMAGAEIHANAIATVAAGLDLAEAPRPLGGLIVLLAGCVIPLGAIRLRPAWAVAIGLLFTAGYLLAAQLSFNAGTIVPVTYPLLAVALSLLGTLAVHYAQAALERQRARDTFARFVAPQVVGEVLDRRDDDLRLGSSRRTATVLFADLRHFTAFAEQRQPERVVAALNRYLEEMSDAILHHGGTLISFMGDGIMAVFGAPLEQPDHADRALAAAREMAGERMDSFNRWIVAAEPGESFEVGIGINSGMVLAGQIGSRRRVEYTAIGDTTNTAARLEAMTKETPHRLFISGACKELLTEDDGLAFVGEFEVRGRDTRIPVWTVNRDAA